MSFSSANESFSDPFLTELKRLQGSQCNDHVALFSEDLHVSHYEQIDSLSIFKVADNTSFFIIQRPLQFKEKPFGAINEWEKVEASSTPMKSPTENRLQDLDITGSPLSCPFKDLKELDLETSLDNLAVKGSNAVPIQSFRGLSLSKARSIASKLFMKLKKNKDVVLPPIWIACDAKDNFRTVFIGVYVGDEIGITCSMTSLGPYCASKSLPSLDYVNSLFTIAFPLPWVECDVTACYDIINRGENSLKLRCKWDKPRSMLSPPRTDTFTTAIVQLESGYEGSRAHFLHRELEVLKTLISGVKEKCLKWYKSDEDSKMMNDLKEYLKSFKERDQKGKENGNIILDLDCILTTDATQLRTNLSFSAEVWNILKGSESLSELKEGLSLVFKQVQSGFVRPQINIRNNTEFAVVCRELMKKRGNLPSLEGIRAVEILLEIGLEKIKNDYVDAFQGWNLLTTKQLSPYTKWTEESVAFSHSKCVGWLEKLHLVLQVVVFLKVNLCLANTSLSRIASKALSELQNGNHLVGNFKFELQTAQVINIMKSLSPQTWIYETRNDHKKDPHCSKWLTFCVKKDENFFNAQTHDGEEIVSLEETSNEKSELDIEKYYCLNIVKTVIDI